MQNENCILPVNIVELQKLIQEDEKNIEEKFQNLKNQLDASTKQYEKVVKQNKNLQQECRYYKEKLKKIKTRCSVFYVNGIKIRSEEYNKPMQEILNIIEGN